MTTEMLREQFEYLLKYHNGECAIENCPDCFRMSVIVHTLERPFDRSQERIPA